MEDLDKKLEAIYKNLELDRTRALDELEALHVDINSTEPKFRHIARETSGQLIKLAIEASVAQAKVLEPWTKSQAAGIGAVAGTVNSKKDFIDAMDAIENRELKKIEVIEPVQMEESVPSAVIAAEEAEIEELKKAAQHAGMVIDAGEIE